MPNEWIYLTKTSNWEHEVAYVDPPFEVADLFHHNFRHSIDGKRCLSHFRLTIASQWSTFTVFNSFANISLNARIFYYFASFSSISHDSGINAACSWRKPPVWLSLSRYIQTSLMASESFGPCVTWLERLSVNAVSTAEVKLSQNQPWEQHLNENTLWLIAQWPWLAFKGKIKLRWISNTLKTNFKYFQTNVGCGLGCVQWQVPFVPYCAIQTERWGMG